jgi:hypothetical protein
MQVHGLGEGVKMAMAVETKNTKSAIIVTSSLILMASIILAGFYLNSTAGVQKYEQKAAQYDRSSNVVWYDVDCRNGPFTDTNSALKYMNEII